MLPSLGKKTNTDENQISAFTQDYNGAVIQIK